MKKLLSILENNARIPLEDLAAMMDMTTEEAAKMMDEAVEQGLILGYQTVIDWEKTDESRVQAYIELHVSPKKSHGFDEIARMIARYEEVDSVYLMSGAYDLLLKVHGKSFRDIAFFVAKRLSTLDDVLQTSTSFLLKTYKYRGRLIDASESDEREKYFL
ncbi:MAG: Lrp/AsnC family transcriptional regulator [Erysipelotrichales bacterium]|nr:Lrp/AsnC family transcriptional regulator [Erysipelotrichales bacterium]MBQ2309307.1 Lrp/AsnC family transcriptional regulator [Erysipelotrichales bacterium]